MLERKFRVVLTGLRYDENYAHTLAIGYMKCYSEADPRLKGFVETVLVERTVHDPVSATVEEILDAEPDAAGFSCYLWNMPRVEILCAELKKARPDLKIVLGGPDVSVRAEEVLAKNPAVDAIVRGEGEASYADLLSRWREEKSLEGCLGISFRRRAEPVSMEERPLLTDLGVIPSPFLAGVFRIKEGQRLALETSRGCPLQCRFCDWQNFQATRWFPAERVIAEVEAVQRQATGVYYFVTDADIMTNKERAARVLAGWDRVTGSESVHWHLQTYLANIDETLAPFLNSPKFSLGAGIETIQPAALKRMVRGFSRRGVERSLGLLQKSAPQVGIHLQLIHGLPADDLGRYRRSLEWALSMRSDSLFLPRALALPGAEFGKYPEQYGILDVMPLAPYRILETETFSREEIEEADRLAFRILNTHRIGPMRRVLEELGPKDRPAEPESAVATPWVDLYERFHDRARTGLGFHRLSGDWYGTLDPFDKVLDREPFSWDKLPAGERLEALAFFAAFARSELASSGRDGEWPVIEHFLQSAEAAVLWDKVLQSESFGDILDALLDGADRASGRILWFGWESSPMDLALCRGSRQIHLMSTLSYDQFEVCRRQRAAHVHLEDRDFGPRWGRLLEVGGPPIESAVLSNVYWAIPALERVEFLRLLRERCLDGARLALWFNDVGLSDLELLSRSGFARSRPAFDEALRRAVDEVREAGWCVEEAPESLRVPAAISGAVCWGFIKAVSTLSPSPSSVGLEKIYPLRG